MTRRSRRSFLKVTAGALAAAAAGDLGLVSSSVTRTGHESGEEERPMLVSAAPADSLVEICGVRISMNEADNGLYGDVGLVLDALRQDAVGLGLRHVREQIILPKYDLARASGQQASWSQIADLGIDFTCVIGSPDNSDGSVQEFADYIRDGLGGNAGMVAAVENANEPNDPTEPWNVSDPDGWVGLCQARQLQMATVFRSDPALDQIVLAGPSLSGSGLVKYDALGDLLPNADVGNFHYYPGIRRESVPSAELDAILQDVAINVAGRPVYCTETGMTNAINAQAGIAYHPDTVAGVYMPRFPLEHFSRGVARMFYFELLDDHADASLTIQNSHFGLLRYDLAGMDPKPAYLSFKRLLDLLRDPGPTFVPRGLSMRVSSQASAYRQLLFEKRDGTHYLFLWRAVSIWDQVTNTPISVDPVEITVELDVPRTVTVFQPDLQTSAIAEYPDATRIRVLLSGEVKVLEFTG